MSFVLACYQVTMTLPCSQWPGLHSVAVLPGTTNFCWHPLLLESFQSGDKALLFGAPLPNPRQATDPSTSFSLPKCNQVARSDKALWKFQICKKESVNKKKTLKCLWEWPLPETMDSDSLSRNFTLQLCLCVCGHSVLISLKPPCVFYIRLYQCLLPSRCFCSRTYDFHISRISYPPEAENLIRRSRSTIYMF